MRRTPVVLAALALAVAVLVVPEGAQAVDPVAGPQTSGDSLFPHQGNGGYDVRHYDVDLAYATDGTIQAVTTITAMSTTKAPLASYSLDLNGLTVTKVSANGKAASFSRVSDDAKQAYKLVVKPATPIAARAAFTTVVTYGGTPASFTDADGSKEGWNTTTQGAVGVNEPIGAMTYFPNNDTPRDKATYVTRISVPTAPLPALQLQAVSNGVLSSTKANADATTTYTWTEKNPMTSYLQLLAIGRYTTSESTIDVGGGKAVHAWNYVDAGSTASAATLAKLPAILRDIGKHYGTYPGTAAGVLVSTSSLGYALETQDRPYFEVTLDQDTMIHEYVHQWFGDNVSPKDWNDVWLNEGPATFTTTLVDHDLYGGATTEATYYDSWHSTAASDSAWSVPTAAMTNQADLFGWQVYERGAMTLEALRTAIGDAPFFKLMRTYQHTYGHRSASSADFIRLAEKISGYDLTHFFQDWIYDADKPAWPWKYDVTLSSSAGGAKAVHAGDRITYGLTAHNTGKVAMRSATVITKVSRKLTIKTSSLPAGASFRQHRLVWHIPATALGATAKLAVVATVLKPEAKRAPVGVRVTHVSLGGTCRRCSTSVVVTQ